MQKSGKAKGALNITLKAALAAVISARAEMIKPPNSAQNRMMRARIRARRAPAEVDRGACAPEPCC